MGLRLARAVFRTDSCLGLVKKGLVKEGGWDANGYL